jgi:hypothetical protein
VTPKQRQDEVASLVGDCRDLLVVEADLGASALAAAAGGSPELLADAAEKLLECHSQFAGKYRKLLAVWLRPGCQPMGARAARSA